MEIHGHCLRRSPEPRQRLMESSCDRHRRRNPQRAVVDRRSMSVQLFYVLVVCCESGAQRRTLERAGRHRKSQWVEVVGEGTRTRHCRTLLLQILSYAFTDETRGSLDTLDVLLQKYESFAGTPLAESSSRAERNRRHACPEPPRGAHHSTRHVRIGLRRNISLREQN